MGTGGGTATGAGGTATGAGGTTTGAGGTTTGAGGTAAEQGTLSGSTTKDFGNVEVGVASATFTWTIRNTGAVAAGIRGLGNTNPTDVMATTTCTATLAAGASCDVAVTVKAATGGARTATIAILAAAGGNVTLAVSANAQLRVTVTVNGAGTVTSMPTGITCGTTCTMLVNAGVGVTLQARTTNGSNLFFSGWGGGCSSPERDCFLTVNASVSAAASFSTMTNNLIFIASTLVPVNKGSAAAYDAVCNTAATAAGINTTAGNGYLAFISDATSLASARMPTSARGWVRMDGKPFGDTLASLLTDHKVFNSIMFHQDGGRASGSVLTGMNQDGGLGLNTCLNWTSTAMSDAGNVGSFNGGPGSWVFWNKQVRCSDTEAQSSKKVICMGTTKSAAVAPVVTAGKRIWVTSTPFLPGGAQTPDAKCQADRPVGVTTAVALLATSTKAASSVLVPTASYVRMDGTLVGTGTELATSPIIIASGIWQSADRVYRTQQMGSPYPLAWTGSLTIGSPGTEASTCGDWTSGSAARMGTLADWSVNAYGWWQLGSGSCDFGQSLYCVQTAP